MTTRSTPAIDIRHLHKRYVVDGQVLPVLNDITLAVAPGEFVGIVGASGCGKSTLLRLIAGLERDFDGTLEAGGAPITGPSLQRGIVFQEHRLFPWLTVEDNIGLGLLNAPLDVAAKRERVQQHVDLVGLQGFERAHPYQLSGGMSQRVAIARALVNRPALLLLDEPFGALDAMTRAHLQRELQGICRRAGVTAVLVTHDVEEAVFLGHRVVVLAPRPGRIQRIVEVDLPPERRRDDPAFAAIEALVRQALKAVARAPSGAAVPA